MSRYTLNIRGNEYRAEIKEITADQATVMVDETEYVVNLVEIIRRGGATTMTRRPGREKIDSTAHVSGPSLDTGGTTRQRSRPSSWARP